MVSVSRDRVVQFGRGLCRNRIRCHLYRKSFTDIGKTDCQRFASKISHQSRPAFLLFLRQVAALDVNLLEGQIAETDRIKFSQR